MLKRILFFLFLSNKAWSFYPGTLSYLNFEQGATNTDATGNYTYVNNGAPVLSTFTASGSGYSLLLNGSSDVSENTGNLSTAFYNSAGEWTWQAWIYNSDAVTEQPMIGFNSAGAQFRIFAFTFGMWSGGADITCVPAPFTANTWTHVAYVHTATNDVKIYINGILSCTDAGFNFGGGIAGTQTALGHRQCCGQRWNGHLDDVRFSNVALTVFPTTDNTGPRSIFEENGIKTFLNKQLGFEWLNKLDPATLAHAHSSNALQEGAENRIIDTEVLFRNGEMRLPNGQVRELPTPTRTPRAGRTVTPTATRTPRIR